MKSSTSLARILAAATLALGGISLVGCHAHDPRDVPYDPADPLRTADTYNTGSGGTGTGSPNGDAAGRYPSGSPSVGPSGSSTSTVILPGGQTSPIISPQTAKENGVGVEVKTPGARPGEDAPYRSRGGINTPDTTPPASSPPPAPAGESPSGSSSGAGVSGGGTGSAAVQGGSTTIIAPGTYDSNTVNNNTGVGVGVGVGSTPANRPAGSGTGAGTGTRTNSGGTNTGATNTGNTGGGAAGGGAATSGGGAAAGGGAATGGGAAGAGAGAAGGGGAGAGAGAAGGGAK